MRTIATTGPSGESTGFRERVRVVAVLAVLYGVAVALGATSPSGHRHACGIVDLGHALVPPLRDAIGERAAEWVWWLGTLPLELLFIVLVVVVLATGRCVRLALCLFAMYALHWLVALATVLPAPDGIVWRFPPGVVTLGKPFASDFWFSGHVANAFVVALATRGRPRWARVIAWAGVPFETLLVLTTRTHYTIDVVGGLFVGYTAHRISLDVFEHGRDA
jgi:hypothetical protein